MESNRMKQLVGEAAASLVMDGMITGIGSGSTVFYLIRALGEKVNQGLKFTAVPTSAETRRLAEQQNIPLTTLNDIPAIDLTIDGADEIDGRLQLIKGGGGALLQEKMVAAASKERIIIADESKLRTQLGSFPLPVEVIPYGWKQVQRKIQDQYNIKTTLRIKNEKPFVTDHGHYILDCSFGEIENATALNIILHTIPGVVETGLFIDLCDKAIIAYNDGSIRPLIASTD